jgi:Sec-independent protein translocase protein TatA
MHWSGAVAIIALGATLALWRWSWERFADVPDVGELAEAAESMERTVRGVRQEMAEFTDRFERASRRWEKRAQRAAPDHGEELDPALIERASKFRDPRKQARVLGLTVADDDGA